MSGHKKWADIKRTAKLRFPCCFCGLSGADGQMMSVVVVDDTHSTDDETISQTWWGHLGCFKNALHPEFRYFRPEFEEDSDENGFPDEMPPDGQQ